MSGIMWPMAFAVVLCVIILRFAQVDVCVGSSFLFTVK